MKKILRLLQFIFGPVVTDFLEVRKEISSLNEPLRFKEALSDFFHIARNTGFVLIPALLSGVIFLFLPQGRDTLLLVIEQMDAGDYKQLVFLLICILIWSMFSELSVRYAIAIADNSGKSLRDSRVYWRKLSQRILASFALFWPILMVIAALIWCFYAATYMELHIKLIIFGIVIFCLFTMMRGLSWLYFHRKARIGNDPAQTLLGARSLPKNEYNWINRLYGMYNEFVYTLLKPSNFKGDYKKDMQSFTDHFVDAPLDFRAGFPQDQQVMNFHRILPGEFKLINKRNIITGRGDTYKWRYEIPNSFYTCFHRQVKRMAIIAMVLMVVIAFVPSDTGFFGVIGAPALICLAFACYSGIYSGLLFIDFGVLRGSFFQARWLLVIVLIVVSVINKDHPVNMTTAPNAPRNATTTQFTTWFAAYKQKMDSVYEGKNKYPVVFICAEGGALRTGAYTSILLTKLQQQLNAEGIDFKQSIFSMSGVSGGALGLAYYNAKAFESSQHDAHSGADVEDAIRFFKYDSMSPIIGKMLFGDFLNLFIPWHIRNFDRAIALEETWKRAYAGTLDRSENNRFAAQFIDGKRDPLKPILIINTTEIESGYQCWVSNTRPDSLLYQGKRDLLEKKIKSISYSTAVNFSTRFPLFSPGAEVDTVNGRFHYLDGGYVENTGAGATLELLNLLHLNKNEFKGIVPIVIYLRFSENDNTQAQNIHVANEFVEILAGIYNTRVGRSFTAIAQLNKLVREQAGVIIDLPLSKTEKDVPMNWMLSDQSMGNIVSDVDDKLAKRSHDAIKVKLFQNNIRYLPIDKNR
jgi:hypothetical protein